MSDFRPSFLRESLLSLKWNVASLSQLLSFRQFSTWLLLAHDCTAGEKAEGSTGRQSGTRAELWQIRRTTKRDIRVPVLWGRRAREDDSPLRSLFLFSILAFVLSFLFRS